MGKSSSEKRAQAAADQAYWTQQANLNAMKNLADSVNNSYQPIFQESLHGDIAGRSALRYILNNGDIERAYAPRQMNAAQYQLSMPDAPEVQSLSKDYIRLQGENAADAARSQFANSERNARRSLAALGVNPASGSFQSAISGAQMAQDVAASKAYTDQTNALVNQDTMNQLRQREALGNLLFQTQLGLDSANRDMRFNVDAGNLQRDAEARKNILGTRIGLAEQLSGSAAMNPAYDMYANLYGASINAANQHASQMAAVAKPSLGSQVLGTAVGGWAGGGFKKIGN